MAHLFRISEVKAIPIIRIRLDFYFGISEIGGHEIGASRPQDDGSIGKEGECNR
jgi:hypothetical protein